MAPSQPAPQGLALLCTACVCWDTAPLHSSHAERDGIEVRYRPGVPAPGGPTPQRHSSDSCLRPGLGPPGLGLGRKPPARTSWAPGKGLGPHPPAGQPVAAQCLSYATTVAPRGHGIWKKQWVSPHPGCRYWNVHDRTTQHRHSVFCLFPTQTVNSFLCILCSLKTS